MKLSQTIVGQTVRIKELPSDKTKLKILIENHFKIGDKVKVEVNQNGVVISCLGKLIAVSKDLCERIIVE